jgi:hypothetical protein
VLGCELCLKIGIALVPVHSMRHAAVASPLRRKISLARVHRAGGQVATGA